jgi:hypothetical protein
MTDTFRALCEELVEELEVWIGYGDEADCADAHVVVDRARAALAEQPVAVGECLQEVHPFVVRHYTNDERPSIKGNGFDGLEIGEDRQEAEEFIAWINKRICRTPPPRSTTMTNLSPAARAVLDAFLAEWPDEALEQDRKCFAAALRAAASQLTSAKASNKLRAIAAELEGQP